MIGDSNITVTMIEDLKSVNAYNYTYKHFPSPLIRWIRHIKEAAESYKKRKDKAQEPAQTDVLAVEPPQIIRR